MSMDEFINAYVKEERKCGERGLATRMLAQQWGLQVYGFDQAVVWHFINQTYKELIHTKYWCSIPWSNLRITRTRGAGAVDPYSRMTLFVLQEYDPDKKIQYSQYDRYYEVNDADAQRIHRIGPIIDGQPDKWKWLELCDSGAKIERS